MGYKYPLIYIRPMSDFLQPLTWSKFLEVEDKISLYKSDHVFVAASVGRASPDDKTNFKGFAIRVLI
jgi:hypothetical protein